MKKILFVIHRLGMGGAEKSLISLLENLPAEDWSIDVLSASPYGEHVDEIPAHVRLLGNKTELYAFENLSVPFRRRTRKVCSVSDLMCQLQWEIIGKRKKSDLTFQEQRWQEWGSKLPMLPEEYDLAISYMHGYCNYYVMDKVRAKRKLLWIHTEFETLGCNPEFERPYFEKADGIVTISQACVDSFLKTFPDLSEKIMVLENISSPASIIRQAAKIPDDDNFFGFTGPKIVSVGRLNECKNFSLAIRAAEILKQQGMNFLWYILGEGSLRESLTAQIEAAGLMDYVKLAGVRKNPYPYVGSCDVFVQSSKWEGKSIALDEAKILCRPVVVTDYTTAYNSIQDGVNGLITAQNEEALAAAVGRLLADESLRTQFTAQLKQENNGNVAEVNKYISLFNKLMAQ